MTSCPCSSPLWLLLGILLIRVRGCRSVAWAFVVVVIVVTVRCVRAFVRRPGVVGFIPPPEEYFDIVGQAKVFDVTCYTFPVDDTSIEAICDEFCLAEVYPMNQEME
jgi:hypothetical protein